MDHQTIVGHFDAESLSRTKPLEPSRALSEEAVERFLTEFPPEVRERVKLYDGYVIAQWSPGPMNLAEVIVRFAHRLAEQEGCIAFESPAYLVEYPESARQAQKRAAEAKHRAGL